MERRAPPSRRPYEWPTSATASSPERHRRERPQHVRSLLELVDGGGFRAGWGCRIEDDEASKTASYDAPVADTPEEASEALRVILDCRGRSLPPSLRRRLRPDPTSGPRHGAAGDAGRCQTRGRRQALLRSAHPAAGAAYDAAYKSFLGKPGATSWARTMLSSSRTRRGAR